MRTRPGRAVGHVGEPEQVVALVRVEQQRPRDRVEHLRGGVDVAALLEPGVPGHADPGERGDLLAAQAGRAAPRGRRQADLLGRDPLAPAAQEAGQLLAAASAALVSDRRGRCWQCRRRRQDFGAFWSAPR